MIEQKQVTKDHYDFEHYMTKPRWNSVWHQIDEVRKLAPERVLEIGPGPGLFKEVANLFGLRVETLDLDPELKPDHVASATALPFADGTFDVVCAFQMLEHLPYEVSLKAFVEMARVSRRHVIISLPDSQAVWHYRMHIPGRGPWDVFVPRPTWGGARAHDFDGEHYWEIGKRGYALPKIIADLSSRIPLRRSYRVLENPYHRFFLFAHR